MGKYGIIYADFAHASEEGSNWNGNSYSYEAGENFKNYYVDGRYEEGPFPANDILVAEGDGNERFLIMALEDVSASTYTWYASKSSAGLTVSTKTGIGLDLDEEEPKEIGKANTEKMLDIWKHDESVPDNNKDIWGISDLNGKWFIPSKDEWSAFADELLPVRTDEYVYYGLSDYYWSSSQYDTSYPWGVYFDGGGIYDSLIYGELWVRLSATF